MIYFVHSKKFKSYQRSLTTHERVKLVYNTEIDKSMHRRTHEEHVEKRKRDDIMATGTLFYLSCTCSCMTTLLGGREKSMRRRSNSNATESKQLVVKICLGMILDTVG
jgi:hypothetical protein